ncbi:hypothetical protein C6N75_09875 [Streptomyces solincola]|uniref:Uncharacterized protein n=1 Tax=Streptomyces solincola TaxID=2100817 RepID=A0A2S9PY99_9ACTN|nr:hypothetical protein [Streptomyces solincola]PRH79382.1 hypothetical protein C6N75_09875 [Streptomyces solincola]
MNLEQSTQHSYDDVVSALNDAADGIRDGLDLSDRDSDLINLMVNVAAATLKQPGISLDEAIRKEYELDPEEVRGWWDW